ncbi:MAG: RluA family pseudouridine synthase [Deltaproteobacteria bacterium]|nr:RluA family pseudouridine synthase [Deltaproteobacteria bacterium]
MARILVTDELAAERLDRLIARQLPGMSRARTKALFAAKAVTVIDGRGRPRWATKGDRAVAGTTIELRLPVDVEAVAAVADPVAADQILNVLEQTDHFVVVDKPAGVPSAPVSPGEMGTVANALVARYPEMAEVGYGPREPGLCHRLDTGTSGILVAARSVRAFQAVTAAIKAGTVDKRYLLVCPADGLEEAGQIDLPLASDPKNRRRVRACRDEREARRLHARPAATHYLVLRRVGQVALVEARAPRAQRHQIRVHFAALGVPLVGDDLYGGPPWDGQARHALHASLFGWQGGEGMAGVAASSPLPEELAGLLEG